MHSIAIVVVQFDVIYILFLLLCYALLFAFSLPHFLLANVVSCAKREVNTKLVYFVEGDL